MKHREDFKQIGFPRFLPAHLVHTIAISGDNSLPGTGSLPTFFQTVRGKVKGSF